MTEMQPMTLRIASINHPPYVILNETRKGVWELSGGIDAYVINILKEKFCFKYEAVIPVEPEWGKIKDGKWTGVIGMVYRNEVDFGISNMMITENRYESIMFSVPYNSDGWLLLSVAPRRYENRQAVLHPFKVEVWFALFVSVLISTCLLFTLQTLRSHFKWTPHLTWRNTLWNVVAVLCQEGVKMSKMQGAALVYFVIWIFSAMILQISYSGTLIGFLTFPTQEPSISSLRELASAIIHKDVKIAYKKHSLAESLLENHEKYGNLFIETIHSHPKTKVSSHVEGFQQVLKDNFVFIANEFGCMYDLYLVDYTKFQMSRVFDRSYIGIAVSHKFEYLKDFNAILRRLAERGLIHKWRSDILSHRRMAIMFKEKDSEDKSEEFFKSKPLKITHLRGAFLLLIIGHVLGTACLITEIFYTKHIQFRETKLRPYSHSYRNRS